MLLTLNLPRIMEQMTTAVVDTIHVVEGVALGPGAKLFDLRVDLSAVAPQDCPPVSMFRIALRDRAWLRRLCIDPGAEVEVDTLLVVFSTTPDESLDAPPARAARITIAGIMAQHDWWSANSP